MRTGFTVYDKAKDLPADWDRIAGLRSFIRRDFLHFLEECNPCGQRYHIHGQKDIILVTYHLGLDMFTFKKGASFTLPLRIAGIPLSLAVPGYVCGENDRESLEAYLQSFGLCLVLNTQGELRLPKGNTLASYRIDLKGNVEEYIRQLKSRYRRRLKKARQKGEQLRFLPLSGKDFGQEHFSLYEEVYERSEGKLEKLSATYFQRMPAQMYELRNTENTLLAFFQIREEEVELFFLFCGVSLRENRRYDTYLNMLLYILHLAYERKCKSLHLGQTTGYSKSVLGARRENLYLHLSGRFLPKVLLEKIAEILGR